MRVVAKIGFSERTLELVRKNNDVLMNAELRHFQQAIELICANVPACIDKPDSPPMPNERRFSELPWYGNQRL